MVALRFLLCRKRSDELPLPAKSLASGVPLEELFWADEKRDDAPVLLALRDDDDAFKSTALFSGGFFGFDGALKLDEYDFDAFEQEEPESSSSLEGEDVLEEDGPEEVDYADDDEELYHVDMDFAVTALCAEDDESPPSPTSPDAFDEDQPPRACGEDGVAQPRRRLVPVGEPAAAPRGAVRLVLEVDGEDAASVCEAGGAR